MKLLRRISLVLLLIGMLTVSCKAPQESRVQKGGAEVISFRALPFDLSNVKLLGGPFKKATDLNVQSLLSYEPDRLLAKFRTEAGLEAKAEHYHGWEDDTIAGHSHWSHARRKTYPFRRSGQGRHSCQTF